MAIADDIAALEAAMAQGVRKVTYADGRAVEYTSQREMLNAISYLRGQQRAAQGKRPVKVSTGSYYRD